MLTRKSVTLLQASEINSSYLPLTKMYIHHSILNARQLISTLRLLKCPKLSRQYLTEVTHSAWPNKNHDLALQPSVPKIPNVHHYQLVAILSPSSGEKKKGLFYCNIGFKSISQAVGKN